MSETLSAIISAPRKASQVPALYLGLAGDAPRTPPARFSLGNLDRVDLGRGDHRAIRRAREQGMETAAITLADSRMSSRHARLTRVGAAWMIDDLASKNGTWVGGAPITRVKLADGDAILVGHTALVYRETGGEEPDLDTLPAPIAGISTLSPSLAARLRRVETAAASALPIQITGPTGTGKELVARAVHAASGRKGKLVAVNCGSIPPSLLEAELFGHRRGAFTGATEDRPGLIRAAHAGTLFLDEIAELPAPAQAALLRVLQEAEVTPVGDDHPIKVDVRVISATHADLAAEDFRADLRARLLGVALELPPLCERREDLGLIIGTLLERHGARAGIAFSADAVIRLYAYTWPLNVRELDRVIGAAVTLAGDRIEVAHLPDTLTSDATGGDGEESQLRDTLTVAVRKHGGNIAAVARELGKDPTQIRRWMKRFGIERPPES